MITCVPISLPTCALSGVFALLTEFLCTEPISLVKNITLPYPVSCRAIVVVSLVVIVRTGHNMDSTDADKMCAALWAQGGRIHGTKE